MTARATAMDDVKDLIADARKARVQESAFPLHTRMLDALETQRDRIRVLEAELEEESGRANDEHLRYMRSSRGELELAAVIEKVRVAATEEFTWQQFGSAVDRILATAPADLLREHDAEVWGKARAIIDGLHPRCTEQCDLCAELDQWLTAFDDANPYQVKPEDEL